MSFEFAVLLWLHIVGAVGWLGAAMVFAMLIGPTLPSLSPASRGDLVVKLFPKYIRWGTIFSLITPIFGLALALDLSNGSFSIFRPNNPFGSYITAGALLSLVMWVLFFGLVAPTSRKIVSLTREMMSAQGASPERLQKASQRLRIFSTTGLLVLFVIVACMVAAATS